MAAQPKRTVIAVVNDLHCGSPFAVSPARWLLHDGNEFRPNPLQEIINDHWVTCWQRVAELRRGARLIVVVLGDAIEGTHHDTTQILTSRLDTQEDMAVAVIESGLKLAKFNNRQDRVRFVTGTPAHDGGGAQSLERIARDVLDLDANDGTRATRDVLNISVNGVQFAAAHKPGSGPGTRAHTRGNAFAMWLKSLYYTALEAGEPPPRYVLTAHHHAYLRRDVYKHQGGVSVTGFICPSWKIKDEFIMQVAPFALASIGMLAFDVEPNGKVQEHDWRIEIKQGEVEEL